MCQGQARWTEMNGHPGGSAGASLGWGVTAGARWAGSCAPPPSQEVPAAPSAVVVGNPWTSWGEG